MSFHVNIRTDLKPIDLLGLQHQGEAVMYVPANPPYDEEQLMLLREGLRTRVPDAVTERFAETFTVAAYRRANRVWLERLRDEVRRASAADCPMAPERVEFLLIATIEALAYRTDHTFVLFDEGMAGIECEACLSKVYDACRAAFPEWELPGQLTVNVVYRQPNVRQAPALTLIHAA